MSDALWNLPGHVLRDLLDRKEVSSVEITSASVARVVATMLGDVFQPITGAHVPIDGGNERVI